jgi:hypothetical protein
MDKLDDSNFMLYAAQNYTNNQCTDMLEFLDDLNRIKYIKRLLKRYDLDGDLKERLILNHLIVLYNVFNTAAMTRMLVFKLYNYLHILKPFLAFLNFWPNQIERIGFNDNTILSDDVPINDNVVDALRKI